MKPPKSIHEMRKDRTDTNDFHAAKIKRMLGKNEDAAQRDARSGKSPDAVVTPKEDRDLADKKDVSGETRALTSKPRVTKGP